MTSITRRAALSSNVPWRTVGRAPERRQRYQDQKRRACDEGSRINRAHFENQTRHQTHQIQGASQANHHPYQRRSHTRIRGVIRRFLVSAEAQYQFLLKQRNPSFSIVSDDEPVLIGRLYQTTAASSKFTMSASTCYVI